MVLIRADGNSIIGAGHIMRCLSIAEAVREAGENVAFAVADETFRKLIENKGFSVYVLGTKYTDMGSERNVILRILRETGAGLCLIDSYFVTDEYLRMINGVSRTAYMDDMMDHAHPVDLLINYNIYAEASRYEAVYHNACIQIPELLIGTEFTPLRSEFHEVIINEEPPAKTIFVSSGGTDTEHVERMLLERIRDEKERFREYVFHFVVGGLNQDWEDIQTLAESLQNVELHRSVNNMKGLICQCSLAVSAAGSTLYELCRCGVPFITYVIADNQLQGADEFMKRGVAVSVGDVRTMDDPATRILDALESVSKDKKLYRSLLAKSTLLIDGKGAKRIADRLLKSLMVKSLVSTDSRI